MPERSLSFPLCYGIDQRKHRPVRLRHKRKRAAHIRLYAPSVQRLNAQRRHTGDSPDRPQKGGQKRARKSMARSQTDHTIIPIKSDSCINSCTFKFPVIAFGFVVSVFAGVSGSGSTRRKVRPVGRTSSIPNTGRAVSGLNPRSTGKAALLHHVGVLWTGGMPRVAKTQCRKGRPLLVEYLKVIRFAGDIRSTPAAVHITCCRSPPS